MAIVRCRQIISDPSTGRTRLCKHKMHFGPFCFIHANCNFLNQIIKIQALYRAYYARKKLKIFYNLPRDLQRKVIFNINKDIHLKHFHCSISNIIYAKYKKLEEDSDIEKLLNYINHIYNLYNNIINELYHILKLTIKYKNILSFKYINLHYPNILNLIHIRMLYVNKNSNEFKLLYDFNQLLF